MKDLRMYFRPTSAAEAAGLKAEYGTRAVYLAGASDLLVHRPVGVEAAIDVRYAGIGSIAIDDDAFSIGGAARLCDIERTLPRIAGGMFRSAVRETAPWLIRNTATLAGNIANASPAADAVPAVLALDGRLELLGKDPQREMVENVLLSPHHTTLGDRLIVTIRIPRSTETMVGAFIKLARSKSDIALVSIALVAQFEREIMRDVRVALGAVAPTVIRAKHTERVLEGKPASPEVLSEALSALQEDIRPITDWRASEAYRRRMSGVLLRRAIAQCAAGTPAGAAA